MRIAIQGYQGSFHQIVAEKYYGREIDIVSCSNFRDVAKMVQERKVDAGIIAIENSIAGSILPNYNLLQNAYLTITGEVYLSIEQNIVGVKGAKLSDIKEIESHPMALMQCLDFLENEMKGVKLVEGEDTAHSARKVAERADKSYGAIASLRSAEIYGLDIIKKNVNTIKNNYTRFLVIEQSDRVITPKDANKASLYFKISHKKGSLVEALHSFEAKGINMSKLQSYPIPTDPFRYLFHVDVEFEKVEMFRDAVEQLKKHSEDFYICGIYRNGLEK